MSEREHKAGDVFQINERHGRAGWIGALVVATEIKAFGIQGFVHSVDSHESYSRAYIRLPWDQLEFIGQAVLVPEDEA
jgi:hypothetical protein